MKAKFLILFLFGGLSSLLGQISGKVYLDGNNDGTQQATEVGFAGVTVTATPPSGAALTATTNDSGTYTIAGASSGINYRVEFTYPVGYADGAIGVQSETSVTFANGGTTNVDLGIYVPASCDPDGPIRVIFGSGLHSNGTNHTVRSWDFVTQRVDITMMGNDGDETPHSNDILDTQSGVPYGIAVQPGTNLAFYSTISSDLTNIFPNDPDGEGVIRVANYDGAGVTYVSMKKLLNFSAYGISTAAIAPVIDGTFGTHGLGGVAISDDGKFLYVINMGKRNIVRFDISSVNYATIPAGGVTGLPFVEISLPNPSCPSGVYRPGALTYYAGNLYLGGVCDANAGTAANLRSVFYRMNPATNAFTQVLSFTPDFMAGGMRSYDWPHAIWSSTYPSGDADNDPGAIQPHIQSIAFDDTGSMIFGTVNREVFVDAGSNRETGYLLRTYRQSDGTYQLESGGISGPFTSTARMRNVDPTKYPGNWTPNPPSITDNGPGGDWFFENGRTSSHPYLYSGGAMVIPGTGYVVGGFADPGLPAYQTGARYLNWDTGVTDYGVSLIGAKATVMAGLDAACGDPTTEVGNRVWMDTDNDGIQDGDEMAIAGVTVQLLNASGTVIATATTDASGQYLFSSDTKTTTSSFIYGLTLTPGVNYTIRIPNVQGGSKQAALGTKTLTTADQSGTTNTETDRIDSDGLLVGNNADVTFQIVAYGANNHTFDFGFSSAPTCTVSIACNPSPQTSCSPANGSATTTVTGGQGNITYLWSSGETTSSITGKVAGTYTVTVTDDFLPGCTHTCQAIIGSTVTLPTAQCDPMPNTNCATPNGSATVTTNANQILWSNGGTTATITGLSANTYTVTVTNTTTGCTNTCQAVVGSTTTLPTAQCDPMPNTNCATPNGSATVTTNANQILWSNGGTTATITGLSANTYTVTVTNTTTGCTNTCQAVVTNSTVSPTCTIATNSQPSCANLTGGSVIVTPSPAGTYTYAWSDNGAATANRTGLTGGTYTVTVTNTTTNCTGVCNVTLNTPTNCCNIAAIVPQNLVCLDNGTPGNITDNRIRFNALVTNTNTSLTSYNVTINGGTTITPNTNVPYGVTQFTLGPGTAGGGATFTVTVTDSATPGCSQTFQVIDPGNCPPATQCPTPKCGTATIQVNGN